MSTTGSRLNAQRLVLHLVSCSGYFCSPFLEQKETGVQKQKEIIFIFLIKKRKPEVDVELNNGREGVRRGSVRRKCATSNIYSCSSRN